MAGWGTIFGGKLGFLENIIADERKEERIAVFFIFQP